MDATIIHAPSSTKNREEKRDPEMHQTKKGNQWYFGMKAHVGVDSKTKIIHTAAVTAANVADATVLSELLHREETRVWGDQAYRGQTEVIHETAPRAQDCTHRRYRYKDYINEVQRAKNRNKSRVRSKVEHVFQILKLKFGFVKVRYRGFKKNANRLFAACALVSLLAIIPAVLLLAASTLRSCSLRIPLGRTCGAAGLFRPSVASVRHRVPFSAEDGGRITSAPPPSRRARTTLQDLGES